jgi:hypothetical protein
MSSWDLIYVAITIGLLGLTLLMIRAFDRM